MTHLQKFYLIDDLAFVYNDLLHCLELLLLISKGKDREYFASDFERILSKFWEQSPCKHWIRIYVMDGILWFAKQLIFGAH